jgi:hypothetical protein
MTDEVNTGKLRELLAKEAAAEAEFQSARNATFAVGYDSAYNTAGTARKCAQAELDGALREALPALLDAYDALHRQDDDGLVGELEAEAARWEPRDREPGLFRRAIARITALRARLAEKDAKK